MFIPGELPEIPTFRIQLKDNKVRSFDILELVYDLRMMENVEDPRKIKEQINSVLGLDFTAVEAVACLQEIFTFAKKEAEPVVQELFGQGLFSTSTTESAPETTTN